MRRKKKLEMAVVFSGEKERRREKCMLRTDGLGESCRVARVEAGAGVVDGGYGVGACGQGRSGEGGFAAG